MCFSKCVCYRLDSNIDRTQSFVHMSLIPNISNQETYFFHLFIDTSSNTKKKKKPDENPFSFKKFLESSGSGSNSRDRNNKIHHSQRNSQNTPDFATDLPDFVQDHFQESSVEPSLPTSLDLPLPDLGFPKESIPRRHTNSFNEQFSTGSNDTRNFSTDSLRAKGVFTPNNSASDLVSGIGEVTQDKSGEQDFMPNRPHVPTRLPDFITDGIFKNTDSVPDNEISLPKPEGYLPNGPQRTRSKDEENERVHIFFIFFLFWYIFYDLFD